MSSHKTPSNRRTFLRLAAVGAASAGVSISTMSQSLPVSPDSSFELDFPVKLDDPDVYRFLGSNNATWKARIPGKSGYTLDGARFKRMGAIDHYPAPNSGEIRLYWAIQESYSVYQGPSPGQLVASFNAVVPMSILVEVQMNAVLFVKDNIPSGAVKKIQYIFDQFDPVRDRDPVVYAQKALAADTSLSADWFVVRNSYQINKKLGTEKRESSRLDTIFALYQGTLPTKSCDVYPKKGSAPVPCGEGESSYFKDSNTRFVKTKTILLDRLPNRVKDPVHEAEIMPGEDPLKKLKDIADADTNGSGCESLGEKDWPLLTLLYNLETRWSWTTVHWVVCGKDISFDFLHVESQDSRIDLWIYLRYPNSWSNVLDTFTQCASDAALTAAVVGVVLEDLSAALAAFRPAFEICITEHFSHLIECLQPGLGLITTVTNPWH